MKTFHRICTEDHTITDGEKSVTLKRGKEYLTSDEKDGKVVVLTNYWFSAPVSLFVAPIEFTK